MTNTSARHQEAIQMFLASFVGAVFLTKSLAVNWLVMVATPFLKRQSLCAQETRSSARGSTQQCCSKSNMVAVHSQEMTLVTGKPRRFHRLLCSLHLKMNIWTHCCVLSSPPVYDSICHFSPIQEHVGDLLFLLLRTSRACPCSLTLTCFGSCPPQTRMLCA